MKIHNTKRLLCFFKVVELNLSSYVIQISPALEKRNKSFNFACSLLVNNGSFIKFFSILDHKALFKLNENSFLI